MKSMHKLHLITATKAVLLAARWRQSCLP